MKQACYLSLGEGKVEIQTDLKLGYEVKLQCLCLTQMLQRKQLDGGGISVLCNDLLRLVGNIKNSEVAKSEQVIAGKDVFRIKKASEESKEEREE